MRRIIPGWIFTIILMFMAVSAFAVGSLKVVIQPTEAVTAGAQWRRMGTTKWFNSGATETNLLALTSYKVEYRLLRGWKNPPLQAGSIVNNQTITVTANYTQLPARQAGRIIGWGYNYDGECTVPSPNSNFVAAAAGQSHSIGLKSDGSVACWGMNNYGQCSVPSPNSGFIAISAAYNQCAALKSDGSIACWGQNDTGECTVPSPNSDFVAVSAGSDHTVGLKSDGSVVCWGNYNSGQCTVPSPNSSFVAIAAGSGHSVGLKSDGSVVCWGWNGYGQCNLPSPNSGFVAIAAGNYHNIATKSDGSLVCWGWNYDSECTVPSPNSGFLAVTAGDCHSLGLRSDGTLAHWGQPAWGLGNPPSLTDVMAVGSGPYARHCLIVAPPAVGSLRVDISPSGAVSAGTQWRRVGTTTWHNSGDTETGIEPGDYQIQFKLVIGWKPLSQQPVTISDDQLTQLTATYTQQPAKQPGHILAWGSDSYGESDVPTPNTDYIAAAAGGDHSVGLKSDGSLVCFGDNEYDQCNLPSPNSGFVQVAAGYVHSVGLKSDGTVVCWGNNYNGRCNVPSPNSGFVAVSAGENHSMGLKNDGSIVCWGLNYWGQTNVPAPNSDFVAISAGNNFSMGLKSDGRVVCWGANNDAECNVPAPNSGFVAIAGGGYHRVGLKADGSVVCWGSNSSGQCNVPSPNSGFTAIAAGDAYTVGLKSNGSLVCWGTNGYGQCNAPAITGVTSIGAGSKAWHSLAIAPTGGSLTVTILPAEAAAAGAHWIRLMDGQGFNSGDVEQGIIAGLYTVAFTQPEGWVAPADQLVVVYNNQLASLTATYGPSKSISEVKTAEDNALVGVKWTPISATWTDVFYLEQSARSNGIRVQKNAHNLTRGMTASVIGIVKTTADGERYIDASSAYKAGALLLAPLGLPNRAVGGCAMLDPITGFGQLGVEGGTGLNNIGMYVQVWGNVVETESVTAPNKPSWVKIDDGSGTRLKVLLSGVGYDATWHYIAVTGISSCERAGKINPIIRATRITKLN